MPVLAITCKTGRRLWSHRRFFVLTLRFGWRRTLHYDMTGQDLRCDALQQAGSWSQCAANSSYRMKHCRN